MLLENLEQGKGIPAEANKNNVKQVMHHLMKILERKINQRFVWPAFCTVAVEAGIQAANKKIKRRKKLRVMIQACAEFIGVDDPTADFPEGWEEANMFYGYGAASQIAKESDRSAEQVVLFAFLVKEMGGKGSWIN